MCENQKYRVGSDQVSKVFREYRDLLRIFWTRTHFVISINRASSKMFKIHILEILGNPDILESSNTFAAQPDYGILAHP